VKSELEHWKDKIILRVLVTTASNGMEKSHPDARDCTSDEEYFVRMGADETSTLFGVAFYRLAKAMKEKKTNITELDESRFGKQIGIKRPRPNQRDITNSTSEKARTGLGHSNG
jgi:capsid protein